MFSNIPVFIFRINCLVRFSLYGSLIGNAINVGNTKNAQKTTN